MYRILLVEDDFSLAEAIKDQLESWGNIVETVTDFQRVTDAFLTCKPQLVLLDVMLPFYNGYHWCGEIRRISTVPIVFLSSASDNMNIVMAVNMGGDDFIAKPVDPLVLTAKVQAVLRRSYELNEAQSVMEYEGAVLNLNNETLEYREQCTELTKNEFRILRTLLENRGKIVSRDALMTALWQEDCYVEENTLTVNVARLRKKLELVGLTDVVITRPGSGYCLR